MPHSSELINSLNAEQRYAATHLWQSELEALQVIAGAGSGKTTTLAAAVCAALDAGFSASRVAVITFSRRAAHELRERFEKYGISVGYCGTMHALAWKLIRASGEKPRILLHADAEKGRIARECFPEFSHIPETILIRAGFLSAEQQKQLSEKYSETLRATNQIDFDGMISKATASQLGKDRFDAVFVDEFQDTSPDQVAFIQSLAARKLFVVGDDWQSIYRFRGADVALTQHFITHFAKASRSYLIRNYRSGKPIVKLGNRVIRESSTFVKKTLKATHPTYHKPVLFFAAEPQTIDDVWQRYLAHLKPKHGVAAEEKTTVLVRTNSLRLLLEKNKPENFEVLTIHKAKGLEFDNVIVFGVAEHILPHRDNDFDEEVRILYVALTRARKFLGFVAWEQARGKGRSAFLPLLMRKCRLIYL